MRHVSYFFTNHHVMPLHFGFLRGQLLTLELQTVVLRLEKAELFFDAVVVGARGARAPF